MKQDLIKGRIYRNFKGKYYYLKDISIDCETREEYVIIQALYPDYGTYQRTKENFFEAGFKNDPQNVTGQDTRFVLVELDEEKEFWKKL